ncbi:TonB-linked SusC/RagA family outer membrane protein [Bacteroides zoogleoformans]|uniref:SusC/RagA family TonB-linked outer membrane protein n=1 Tax=Bacteroides zoogleoformans TaxID=28119 RepID=A0ABN5INF2_9BACE|nr:TonB-dependent receptor [Bacteroides zoogleoformans]AVM53383.1 SusC/RagA family TonB-linked outer membrane protein [Bacteroides zoogleoformans]TWJ17287.1 TonB-linked SusC/RagA family outer membrane protein [Bacteroides zoogleoformans]
MKTHEKRASFSRAVILRVATGFFLVTGAGISPVQLFAEVVRTVGIEAVRQQSVTVTGIVKDKNGDPVIGANVLEKGTINGVITDIDGRYTLKVQGANSVLSFSYIGYKTQEITVGNNRQLDITLQDDTELLDEVVVIGYGTQKKGDVTSAISSVKAENFVKGAVADAGQLIQGKVAGLNISLPSGDPTGNSQIMLRGISSLKGGTSPLVLVDGVPGSLNTVAPEDIESIDVLKDGSATAIYGTRGTNGVIIITTKQSRKEMPPTIDYNGYMSVSNILKRPDFMSADDLRRKWSEGYTFNGANLKDFGADTDWLGELTRTAISHSHNLSLRGGSRNTNYTASANYTKRQGTFIKTDFEAMNARMDISHSMYENKLTADVSVFVSQHTMPRSWNTYAYRQALIHNPTEPIKDEGGNWFERDLYFYDNPVAYIRETIGEMKRKNIRFNGGLTFRPIESLILKAMYARRSTTTTDGYYQTKKHVSTTKSGRNGYAYRYDSDFDNNLVELTAHFQKAFGKHNVSALVGYNYEDNTNSNMSMTNYDFPTDAYSYNKMEAGMALKRGEASMTSYKSSDKLIGVFARVSYNFNDRYLLMASLRHEGSSKFGKDHKWGNFPGMSLGWRIDKENFMKSLNWLDNLKFRVGYGVTGINVAAPYTSLSGLNYEGAFLYNGTWVKALETVRNNNADLRWEKKHEFNIGLDWDILNGRVGGSVDYYIRKTKDALWDYPVPVPPFMFSSMLANASEMENKGLEILVRAMPVQTDRFTWNTSVSYSTNTNKIVALSSDKFSMTQDYFYSGYTGEPIQTSTHIVQVGKAIGTFYGLKSVDITEDGLWLVENKKGEHVLATEADATDWQVLGNGIPKHYLNWNNTFKFFDFDLSVNMRGAFGFQILNFQRMYYENAKPEIQYNRLNSAFDKVYGKTQLKDEQRYVSYYIEDGDYWKIDNVTLGYTVKLLKQKVIKNLRVYASVLNLATITGYKGMDPEVPLSSSSYGLLDAGTDNRDKYPTNRTYTFGVNLTF